MASLGPQTGFVGGLALQNNNSRWRRPPSWISFIVHSSLIIAYICTKFGMLTQFTVLHMEIP